MADKMPNNLLAKKRLAVELGTMNVNLDRMDLRLMELDAEKDSVKENMEATKKRIIEITEQLEKLGA